MKKSLLSLCLLIAAAAAQAFAVNTASNNLDDIFGDKRFTVQVSTGEGGQIEISGTGAISQNSVASATINTGEDVELIITPDEGYVLATLYVDGEDVLADVTDGIYTITAISKNMSVSATFEEEVVSITGDVNLDGQVNAADAVAVYNYVAYAEESGYLFENADVNVDGDVTAADAVVVYNIIVGAE